MRSSFLLDPRLFGLFLVAAAGCVGLNASGVAAAAGTVAGAAGAAAPSVMQLGNTRPDLKRALTLINTTDANLVAYLSDPKVKCTFFAPTNKAIQKSFSLLGKNAGLAAQNKTLNIMTFKYHVLPGVALTAADLTKLNKTNTRANQTLYFMHRGGKSYVYSRPEYPLPLVDTNIRAGNCIVHTIDTQVLVPVDALPLVHGWLDETGTAPPVPPLAEWAPAQDAYLQSYVDAQLKKEGKLNATTTAEPAAAPAAKSSAAAACAIANGAFGLIVGAGLLLL